MSRYVICYGLPDNSFAFFEIQPGHKISSGQPHIESFSSKQAALNRLVAVGYTPDLPTLSTEQQMPLAIDLSAFKMAMTQSATVQAAVAASMEVAPLTCMNLVTSIARAETSGDFSEFVLTFGVWVSQSQAPAELLAETLGMAAANGFPPEVLAQLTPPEEP